METQQINVLEDISENESMYSMQSIPILVLKNTKFNLYGK